MDYPMQDPTGMPSVREPHRWDEVDMKFQIHCMEKEAYSSVLRAFIAQSDLLSWGKEGLITDLRRELNVTDTEHGELLVKINSDESIKMIREWRKSAPSTQESLSSKVTNPGTAPTSGGSAPLKKMKTSHASVSRSQKYVSHDQPSSATLPAQFRDIQPAGDLAVFSSGQSMKIVSHNIQEPSNSKGRVLVKSHSKKGFHAPDLGNPKKRSDVIEIRATDKLIHEVESVIYGRKIPDLVQIEKAKSILREHERTILEALAKLADVSDGDDSPNQMEQHYSHEELPGNGRGMAAHSDFLGQAGRFHGYPSGSFVQSHSVRARIPSHDARDDDDDDDETP